MKDTLRNFRRKYLHVRKGDCQSKIFACQNDTFYTRRALKTEAAIKLTIDTSLACQGCGLEKLNNNDIQSSTYILTLKKSKKEHKRFLFCVRV